MADLDEQSPLVSSGEQQLVEVTRRNKGRCAVGLICVAFMLERFVFYCCLNSLHILLRETLCYGDTDTLVIIPLLFEGAASFLAVFGGVLADGVVSLGTTGCIILGGIIYLIGVHIMLVPVSVITMNNCISCSLECFNDQHFYAIRGTFFTGLFIVALGSGIYRANATVLCGKQASHFFAPSGIKTAYAVFYWFINLGAILSTMVVLHLGDEFPPNTTVLFIAAITAMVLSLAMVYVGLVKVFCKEEGLCQKSLLMQTFKTLCTICSEKCPCSISLIQPIHDISFSGSLQRRDDNKQTAKQLAILVPMFATFTMFWTVYSQMVSSYATQAEKMSNVTNSNGSEYQWTVVITLFDDGSVLIFIPLIYLVLYKGFKKCGYREIPMLTRMGIGIVMMILSVIVAGIVETVRLHNLPRRLNVWVLLPQTVLVALGEVFATITGLEFAFTQSPVGLEGTVIGVYYCSVGFASFVGTELVTLVNVEEDFQWYPMDIDDGHLNYYMFLLAGLVTVSLVFFIFIAKRYHYISRTRSGDIPDLSVSGRYV